MPVHWAPQGVQHEKSLWSPSSPNVTGDLGAPPDSCLMQRGPPASGPSPPALNGPRRRPPSHRELHMSDLGSLENLFDDNTARLTGDTRSDRSSSPDSLRSKASGSRQQQQQQQQPSSGHEAGTSWRPWGGGFRLPGWGRRFANEPAAMTRSASDGALATGVSTNSGSSHRPQIIRASTSSMQPVESNTDEGGDDREEVALMELASRFAGLVISEELGDADQSLLRAKIDALQKLQNVIVQHLYTKNLTRRERVRTLLESVVEEIAVYGEFLEATDVEDELGFVQKSKEDGLRNYVQVDALQNDIPSTGSAGSRSVEDSPSERSSETSAYATPLPYSPRMPGSHSRQQSFSTSVSVVSATSSTAPSLGGLLAVDANIASGMSPPPGPKDVLRWTPLQRLSLQLYTGAMRQKWGTPTCMHIAGAIFVGTSRSMVLVYDFGQTLKAVLGDPAGSAQLGSVTSISLGFDRTQLVCGYGYGTIRVWDIQKRIASRVILPITAEEREMGKKNGHAKGASVVHIAFVGSKGAFVSADNEGYAFHHAEPKLYLMNTSYMTCIHNNTVGASPALTTVYALAVLPRIRGHLRYPGDNLHLVALATPDKVAIMSMKPSPQPQFRMSWSHGTDRFPEETAAHACRSACLAWSPLPKTVKDGKTIKLGDPLIACSFGRHLRFIRVSWRSSSKSMQNMQAHGNPAMVEFIVQRTWSGEDDIVALEWLDDKFMLLLTDKQTLISFDVRAMKEIERTDVQSRKVLGVDVFSRSLQSLHVHPNLAFYQSCQAFKGHLFILGQREIIIAGRLSWTDRIKALVIFGHFQDAINLGLKFYSGAMQHCVTGLPRDGNLRREAVSAHLVELLMTYIGMLLASYDAADRQLRAGEDLGPYRQLAATAFDSCLAIKREDLLFGDVYEQFCDKDLQAVFLEVLEVYILDERVTSFSNPTIVQDFMAHFQAKGWLDRLEQVILHLDVAGLDVHNTIETCRAHGLYSGLIYVYTRIGDFVMPIVELLQILASSHKPPPERPDALADTERHASFPDTSSAGGALYTLYVYIAYTLTGKAFPVGILEPTEATRAKENVYSFLMSCQHASWPPDTGTHNFGEAPYPYLRLLYALDSREFLKAVAEILADKALDGATVQIRQDVFVRGSGGPSGYALGRQWIMDALFYVVEGDDPPDAAELLDAKSADGANQENVADLYSFAARNYARFGDSFQLETKILRRVIFTLALYKDKSSLKERQHAILTVLSTGYEPAASENEAARILEIYQSSGLWQVYEFMVRRREEYHLVLRSYLQDPDRRERCFTAVQDLVTSDHLTALQQKRVKSGVLDSIVGLIAIDEVETAALVSTLWPKDHGTVIERLAAAHPNDLFSYLMGLLDADWVLARRPTSRGSSNEGLERASVHKRVPLPATLGEDVYERYIGLLCDREPSRVKPFLESVSIGGAGYPYNFDRVLALCKKHGAVDAAAWILEQSGNVDGALDLILEHVRHSALEVQAEEDGENVSTMLNGVEMALQLCRRSSVRFAKTAREALWFRLLDGIIELQHSTATPQSRNADADSTDAGTSMPHLAINTALVGSSREILYSMVGHVSLHSIVRRIVQAQPTATVGEHRAIVESMLESYAYERELLEATNRILTEDVHASHVADAKLRGRALRPARGQCAACRKLLHVRAMGWEDRTDGVAVMPCGHAYHVTCLAREMGAMAIKEEWWQEGDVEAGAATLRAAKSGGGWCVVCAKSSGSKKADAKEKAFERVRRSGKGKQKATVETAPAPEPAEIDEPLSKIAQADLYLQVSSRKPTSSLYTLLTPHHHGAHHQYQTFAQDDDGVIDHGYASSPYGSTTSSPAGTLRDPMWWGSGSAGSAGRRLPPDLVSNPRRFSLTLAPPDLRPASDPFYTDNAVDYTAASDAGACAVAIIRSVMRLISNPCRNANVQDSLHSSRYSSTNLSPLFGVRRGTSVERRQKGWNLVEVLRTALPYGLPSSGGDAPAALAAAPSGLPKKTDVSWVHTEMQLGEWTPAKVKATNVGEVLRMPANILANASLSADSLYPPGLARQGLSAFMLRQTTLDVIDAVRQQAEKNICDGVIALDGPRGVGKSVTLLQTATHFAKEGWIVFYVPQPAQWVNGTEPFEPSLRSPTTYVQPAVAARILEQFLKLNGRDRLAKLKIADGRNVADVAQEGVSDPSHAQAGLDEILAALAGDGTSRPRILVAVDQVNTFYCTTAYHDTASQPITANKLEAVRSFASLFSLKTKLPNAALICAADKSDTQHRAPVLAALVEAAKPILASGDKSELIGKRYHDVTQVDEFGVLLPQAIAPASYDPLASETEFHPKIAGTVAVPGYDLYEVASAAAYYSDCGVFSNDVRIDRDFVEKELALTGGNALKLHRRCLSL
ncbi:Vacuolar protein sorting-associated protein 8 [Geranomyces michiganensis]|nr:Vacuolar protein sorting-associated protein 8 [Geranomyces michiganensis]